ncbi:MAG TPA: hypothetical protein DHN29_06735 [Cytophagales bacterium]|nr:hypothetical protein [Cytophagales bacterium]
MQPLPQLNISGRRGDGYQLAKLSEPIPSSNPGGGSEPFEGSNPTQQSEPNQGRNPISQSEPRSLK